MRCSCNYWRQTDHRWEAEQRRDDTLVAPQSTDLFVLCATREEELKEPEACVSQTAVGVAEEKPNMFILYNNAKEKKEPGDTSSETRRIYGKCSLNFKKA